MQKLKMHSPNLSAHNLQRLAELFPSCVVEARDPQSGALRPSIDFDQLRQELAGHVVEGPRERYHLDWPGKREAILAAHAPIAKTLRPCRDESLHFDSTKNLFIEGDNLDALKLLQETYLGKVKLIYIDPPYNTGNDFIYKDRFGLTQDIYASMTGTVDQEGNRLVPNPESNGRRHSEWLSMLYPRLKLARNLLADNGLIFISIDDWERDNLRKLCDEVFGEANFVDAIIWKKRYGGGAKEKHLVSLHEYILVYARNIDSVGELFVPQSEASIQRYYTKQDKHFATRGPFRTHPLEATKSMGDRPNLVFPIPAPDGGSIYPKRQWLWSRERVALALKNDEIEFVKDRSGNWTPHSKQYLKDESGEVRKAKAFSIIESTFSQHGTNELTNILGHAQIFPFPKPILLIRQLLELGAAHEDDIVLDFFAGSGTTAHAVMDYNASDGGRRRFVIVQIPQEIKRDENLAAADFCDKNGRPRSISEIAKERVRRAGLEILERHATTAPDLDVGFRVLKVDTSNMRDVYYLPDELRQGDLVAHADNIKEGRSGEDLLFQVLVDWGVDLSLPIGTEVIAGKRVFFVDGNALAACFETGIGDDLVREVARRRPLRAVFRDSSHGSDSEKINVGEVFKVLSPTTEVRTV